MSISRIHSRHHLLIVVTLFFTVLGPLIYWTGYNSGIEPNDRFRSSDDELRVYKESLSMYDESGVVRQLEGYPPAILWLSRIAQTLTPKPQYPQPVEAIAIVRLFNGIFNVFTLICLFLIGRQLHSEIAGVIVSAAWLLAPLIVSRVNLALTEPGQAFFVVLSGYFAINAIDYASGRAAILSVLAALVAVLFKYSAFSALGFGIGVVFWHLRTNPRKWMLVLIVQLMCMALAAYWLLNIYGASALSDNPEGAAFLNGLSSITLSGFMSAFIASAEQIGWSVQLLLIVYTLGTVFYLRNHSATRRYIWIMTSFYVIAYYFIMLTYIVFWAGVHRYLTAITPILVLLISISLIELASTIAQRLHFGHKLWKYAIVTLCAALWIVPQAMHTFAYLSERSRIGNTLMSTFTEWTAKALPEGTIRLPKSNGYTHFWHFLDPSWWGYAGQIRPWIQTYDIAPRTLDDWRAMYVRYLSLQEYERQSLLETATGQGYFDQMLLLRDFPTRNEDVRFYVYSTDAIENPVGVTFGGQIKFLGYNYQYSIDRLQVQPYWQALELPDHDYQIFIHLAPLNSDKIISQDDGTPALPAYTTSQWKIPNEIILGQSRTIQLPADMPQDAYEVRLGLYDLQTGIRLTVENGRDFIVLRTINIPISDNLANEQPE